MMKAKSEKRKAKSYKLKFVSAGLVFLFIFLLVPVAAYAQGTFQSIGDFIKVPTFFQPTGPAGQTTFRDVILGVLNIALLVVGALAVIFLVWGGFRYITSYGNEEQAESAKRIIRHSILGLIIVIFSFAIVTIISNILIAGRP